MTKEEKRQRRRASQEKVVELLGLYFEDLLFVSAGICFIASAAIRYGYAAALAVAGICFAAYAVTVARAKRGK